MKPALLPAALLLGFALGGGAPAAPVVPPPAPQAQAGEAMGAYRLALKVRNGEGMPADPARAVALFTVAAEGGVPAAMFVLSNMLAAGEGVPPDAAAARRWLETAAEREYPEALQQLALTETDPRKAELLMRQAAHAMTHRVRD